MLAVVLRRVAISEERGLAYTDTLFVDDERPLEGRPAERQQFGFSALPFPLTRAQIQPTKVRTANGTSNTREAVNIMSYMESPHGHIASQY
jgi:hypothetical protein